MADSDDLYTEMEADDILSTALGTETPVDCNMVPPGFVDTPTSTPSLEVLTIDTLACLTMSTHCGRVFSSAKS